MNARRDFYDSILMEISCRVVRNVVIEVAVEGCCRQQIE